MPGNRSNQGGLEFRQRERQRGCSSTQVQFVEHREKVQAKARIKQAPLHRILQTPDDDDPPAIKHPALRWGEHIWCRLLLHACLSYSAMIQSPPPATASAEGAQLRSE